MLQKLLKTMANFGNEMVINGNEYKLDREKQSMINDTDPKDNNQHKSNDKTDKIRDIKKFVKEKLKEAHEKTKHEYNLRHRPVQYNEGDFVWKREYNLSDASKQYSAKLGKKFSGPYKIKKKLGINVYELESRDKKSKGKWHIKDLKLDTTLDDDEKW